MNVSIKFLQPRLFFNLTNSFIQYWQSLNLWDLFYSIKTWLKTQAHKGIFGPLAMSNARMYDFRERSHSLTELYPKLTNSHFGFVLFKVLKPLLNCLKIYPWAQQKGVSVQPRIVHKTVNKRTISLIGKNCFSNFQILRSWVCFVSGIDPGWYQRHWSLLNPCRRSRTGCTNRPRAVRLIRPPFINTEK